MKTLKLFLLILVLSLTTNALIAQTARDKAQEKEYDNDTQNKEYDKDKSNKEYDKDTRNKEYDKDADNKEYDKDQQNKDYDNDPNKLTLLNIRQELLSNLKSQSKTT